MSDQTCTQADMLAVFPWPHTARADAGGITFTPCGHQTYQ